VQDEVRRFDARDGSFKSGELLRASGGNRHSTGTEELLRRKCGNPTRATHFFATGG
jgi:hypothetical protein